MRLLDNEEWSYHETLARECESHHLDMHGIDKYPPFQMGEFQESLGFLTYELDDEIPTILLTTSERQENLLFVYDPKALHQIVLNVCVQFRHKLKQLIPHPRIKPYTRKLKSSWRKYLSSRLGVFFSLTEILNQVGPSNIW
jgi:hypothetical protein